MDIQARKKAIGQLCEAMNRGKERAKQGQYSYTRDEEEKLFAAFKESDDLEAFANTVETQQLHLGNISDIQYWKGNSIKPESVEKLFGVGFWSGFIEDKEEQNFIAKITREDQVELVNTSHEVSSGSLERITEDTFGLAFAEAGGTLEDDIPAEAWFVPEFVRGYIESFSFEHELDRKSEDEQAKDYIEELKIVGKYIKTKLEQAQLRSEQAKRMEKTTDITSDIESGRGV